MVAFWKYDLYPYCLSGTVVRENSDGTVYIKEYCFNVRPIAVLPDCPGQEIAQQLNILREEYTIKTQSLSEEYLEKSRKVAHFL